MAETIKDYLKKVEQTYQTGIARELSYRSHLEYLIKALGKEILGESIDAINDAKHIPCGAPDFIVKKSETPIGYIETKDIGVSLKNTEESEQLNRYRLNLPNLILTDYLEFRWYVNGECQKEASLGSVERNGKVKAKKDGIVDVREMLSQFLSLKLPSINTAKDLATRMAKLARLMHDAAIETLENEPDTGTLKGWLAAFEKTLVPNLSQEQFSDMYAQTLIYGLFAAKVMGGADQDMRRDNAAGLLPETNPLLKRLFYHLAGPEVPPTVSWVVDDMVKLLNAVDIRAVMADFGQGSLVRDPVIHFYETFLQAYDPEKRKNRGVYYTPEPVVSYIVRGVDYFLKASLKRPWGLADKNTLILDPACGTGTFLHSVIALIYDTLCSQGQQGAWCSYVSQSLLPRVLGFELLMAPYAVAHLKLGLLLQERGFDFPLGQRLGVYLTNTLDEDFRRTEVLPLTGFITEESNSAARIKKEDPVEVVLGNPPYAGYSANASSRKVLVEIKRKTKKTQGKPASRLVKVRTFIGHLIEDYKLVDGKPLGEKQSKWLDDDYVKFIRWGQWRIAQTGQGIVAMITNHSYLDNLTFRGMRQSLMKTFNQIYILNLHGNTLKGEHPPNEIADKNVFNIQQGVAIGLFLKSSDASCSRVYYADLWGTQEDKYQKLTQLDISTTPWQELQPSSPHYLFVPQVVDLQSEYEQGWPIPEIFPVSSVGIVTARDSLTIHWTEQEAVNTIKDFARLDTETAREKYCLGRDVQSWKVEWAQNDLRTSGLNEKLVSQILYRPFDVRYTYYTGKSSGFICRPCSAIMDHMLTGKNLALITSRMIEERIFSHTQITRNISDSICMSPKTSSSGYVFPLYIYEKGMFLGGRKPNINPKFLEDISERLGLTFVSEGNGDTATTFGPEDILSYIYAVLHSPAYRQRYSEFLRADFPCLPFTSNKALFVNLIHFGKELVSLHLMESPYSENLITRFDVSGSCVVAEKEIRYQESDKRVYINAEQYFEGVTPEVWSFNVGGYQVCEKWLKSRKRKELTDKDIERYQKIISVLSKTITIMEKIDSIILDSGGFPLE